jgi:hypothetical protein
VDVASKSTESLLQRLLRERMEASSARVVSATSDVRQAEQRVLAARQQATDAMNQGDTTSITLANHRRVMAEEELQQCQRTELVHSPPPYIILHPYTTNTQVLTSVAFARYRWNQGHMINFGLILKMALRLLWYPFSL